MSEGFDPKKNTQPPSISTPCGGKWLRHKTQVWPIQRSGCLRQSDLLHPDFEHLQHRSPCALEAGTLAMWKAAGRAWKLAKRDAFVLQPFAFILQPNASVLRPNNSVLGLSAIHARLLLLWHFVTFHHMAIKSVDNIAPTPTLCRCDKAVADVVIVSPL